MPILMKIDVPNFEPLTEIIRADLYRHRGRTDWEEFLRITFTSACFHVIVLMRCRDFFNGWRVIGAVSDLVFAWASSRRAIEIPQSVRIGPGFIILHAGSLTVNKGATIGRNCTVVNHATIGGVFRGDRMGAPTIGDHVYLGSYACVFGRVVVGRNVLVAAHAVVTADVENDAVVGGAPARVLNRDGAGVYVGNRVG